MSDKYVKTSAEELTAMADELRAVGPFTEDQKFTFPSSSGTIDGTYDTTVTKLMPKFGSTTVIERNGVCESWVKIYISDEERAQRTYRSKNTIRPNYNSYQTQNFDDYFIYGLPMGLSWGEYEGEWTHTDLNECIEVTNGGYFTVTYKDDPSVLGTPPWVGTESIINVYNVDDQLVEQFHVIIFGDLDGDAHLDINDENIALQENNGHTSWSNSNSQSYNKYKTIAADLDDDGYFQPQDESMFEQHLLNHRRIDQVRGLAVPRADFPVQYDFFGLGFAEAYQELIDIFIDKITFGTLTQEDVDGVVFSEPLGIFGDFNGSTIMKPQAFPSITELTISEYLLNYNKETFYRAGNLKKVNVIDCSGSKIITADKFYECSELEEISYSPIEIESWAFRGCSKLKFGSDYLNLNNCTRYRRNCLEGTSLTEVTIAEGAIIETEAFRDSQLEAVYLPDIPPELGDVDAFYNVSPNLNFYVSSQLVIEDLTDPNNPKGYKYATNWSNLISKFQVVNAS